MMSIRTCLLIVALMAPWPTNRAQAGDLGDFDGYLRDVYTVPIIAGTVPCLAGSVPIIFNSVAIARDHRPSFGWLASGFILGTVNLAVGVGFSFWSAEIGRPSPPLLAFAVPNLVIGATNIGLAIGGLTKPPKWMQVYSVTPIVMSDGRGNYNYGVGFGRVF